MDEVGRQASIFKQASKAFAWLSHLHAQELSQHYHILENIGPQLDDGPDGQNEERCRVIYRSTVHILSDPWFTSLWTLQELFMRSDALILSNEGVPVPTTSNHPLHLEMIANFYQNLMSGLRFRADPEDLTNAKTTKATVSIPQMISHHRAIKELVNRSGLLHSFDSSPNAQYGCAKFRCTEYPEDRDL
ncbi:hypothetical protein N0V93_005491 [Gnomoniopsis smithogilvyi]|uniref:Heterokaryon incompatibility domain-containing protein n=1 Tax=Gnomoniopsis smithogilvyi TaxID=1191159 RepID=A0A9W8YSY7_9PEZI|nr:hypothetical protein N0V93_005491 [Gnomoniopsis smithogilvyi]